MLMKKPQLGFDFNESRASVVNKDFAKFRCNGLFVGFILNLTSQVELNSIRHKTKVTEGTFYDRIYSWSLGNTT
jgi:hypothetical protein